MLHIAQHCLIEIGTDAGSGRWPRATLRGVHPTARPRSKHALSCPESGLASVLFLVSGLPAIDHAAMRSAIGRIVVS
jgi:hypothetical protein